MNFDKIGRQERSRARIDTIKEEDLKVSQLLDGYRKGKSW